MKQKKKALLLSALIAATLFTVPVQAASTGLNDLASMVPAVDKREEALKSDSWAYKTLKDLCQKYGVLMDIPQEKFSGTKPLTRNEAALILVNLMGKIQKENSKLTPIDKERLQALNENLQKDVAALTARVEMVEQNMETLQGEVSELSAKSASQWSANSGTNHKLGGSFAAGYGHYNTAGNDAAGFTQPYAAVYMTGKLGEHMDYFGQLFLNNEKYRYIIDADLLERLYVSSDIVPHHKIKLGKMPKPVSEEGVKFFGSLDSASYYPYVINGMGLIRRDIGATITGDWKYLEYTAGAFNESGSNDVNGIPNTTSGVAFVGRAVLKPLANTDKYGKLKVGTSYYTSKNEYYRTPNSTFYGYMDESKLTDKGRTDLLSTFVDYKKDKFEFLAEYIQKANNYDLHRRLYNTAYGVNDYGRGDANGFYVKGTYMLTPKLQVLGMYDRYSSGLHIADAMDNWTVGLNYFLKYPNIKLQSQYTYRADDFAGRTNRYCVQTTVTF